MHDFFEAIGAVLEAGFVVNAVPVARKTDDIFEARLRRNPDQPFIKLDEVRVVFGLVPTDFEEVFQPFRRDHLSVEDQLAERQLPMTVDGLLKLLVASRGEVHHYLDPRKKKGTPLSDHQYEALAMLMLDIVSVCLSGEFNAGLASLNSKNLSIS